MEVGVADHPDAPGCWLLMIEPPRFRTPDADALLEVLRPADGEQAEANEKALADHLLVAGRYQQPD